MSLASRMALLASRIGIEVKSRIDAGHPGVAKAWVCFGYVDSQIVIRAAYNIANVTRTATGRYRVTFAGAMSDDHYCWTALARSSSNNSTQRLAIVRATSDQKTPEYVDISCATTSASFADSTEINLMVLR